MKYLLLTLFSTLSLFAAAPDCQFTYHFTNVTGDPIDNKVSFAPGAAASIDNKQQSCIGWQMQYSSFGFSAVSINLQTAVQGASSAPGGTWSTYGGTAVSGTLPITSTSAGNYVGYGYYPYLRVNLASSTGTGYIDVTLYGWKSIAYLAGIGGGSGGGAPSGAAGGDLSSTYPNPIVARINDADIPVSKTCVGTNSSGQIIEASCGGSPGGSSGNIQYNNSGALGGRVAQGNATRVQMTATSSNPDVDTLTAYDANGNILPNVATCKASTSGLQCGDGTISNGVKLSELTANGSNYFAIFGADSQTTDGCIIAKGDNLANTTFMVATNSTAMTSQGYTCRIMNWLTPSGVLDLIGATRGSILSKGASGWTIITPGTSTYVLTSNGAGADPTYQAPTGGLPTFSTQNLMDGATITFDASSAFLASGKVTLGGNRTLAVSNLLSGGNYWLEIEYSGSYGLTLGAGCSWVTEQDSMGMATNGILTLSSASGKKDLVKFYYDGTYCLTSTHLNYTGVSGFPNGYTSCFSVDVPNGAVGSTLTDYPLHVFASNNSLKSTGNGGDVTDAQGDDIVFVANTSSSTPIDFQRITWSASAGTFEAVVKVTIPTTGVSAYFCAGNSMVTTNQGSTGVWNSSHKGVWMLSDNAATTTVDEYTSNAVTGANFANTSGKSVTGPYQSSTLGKGLTYNGTNDYTDLTNSSLYNFTSNPWSLMFWFKPITLTTFAGIMSRSDLATNGFLIQYSNQGVTPGEIVFLNQGVFSGGNNGSAMSANTWYCLALVKDASGNLGKFYTNGTPNVIVPQTLVTSTSNFYLGQADGGATFSNMSLAYLRAYNSELTQDWISASCNNDSDPATFAPVTKL